MKQKVCIVAGSSGGIGCAIIRKLRENGHYIIGLDKAEPDPQTTPNYFINVDLASERLTGNACSCIKNKFKEIWGLVYSAGLYYPHKAFAEYDTLLWRKVFSVNVTSAFIISRDLCPLIVPGGRIVMIISGAAHVGSHDPAYSSSKAALLGLMKSLALNLADKKVLVNAICPGPIDTPMSKSMPENRVAEYKQRMLVHRFGEPMEVATIVAFLLSPENSFMTGATVDVNGGLYLR